MKEKIRTSLTALVCCAILTGTSHAVLIYEYTPRSFFTGGATGPSWGRIVIADGFGAGDSFGIANVLSFEFMHTFDADTTIHFDTTAGHTFNFLSMTLRDDLQTLSSGSLSITNSDADAGLRMSVNSSNINDNYVVDSPANTNNGAYGGAFGGWDLVLPPPLVGDFNDDGLVDARDYVVWRNGLGTDFDSDDYQDWKANYGAMADSGSAALVTIAAPIPEPATWLLALAAACLARPIRGWHRLSAARALPSPQILHGRMSVRRSRGRRERAARGALS